MRTLHIVMPMAGEGSRFLKEGWTTPKPLIMLDGQPLFKRAISSAYVGTAIMTDKLAVKCFHPFDEEVTESVEMGYLLDKEVDWEQFKKDLRSLPHVNKQHILKRFEEKWAPIKVAAYIVEECIIDL